MKSIKTTSPAEVNKAEIIMKATYGVHASVFHADDVLCVGWLKATSKINDVHDVIRTNNPDEVSVAIDFGGGKYDHHQLANVPGKPCSFEILVNEYIDEHQLAMDRKALKLFLDEFVKAVSATDNFGQEKYPSTLAWVISNLNKDINSPENSERFYMAAELCSIALQNCLEKAERISLDIARMFDDWNGEVISYPSYHVDMIVWKFIQSVQMVIEASPRGGFNVTSVNGTTHDFTGCEGLTFQHPGKWIACFDTKEHAIQAAEAAEINL